MAKTLFVPLTVEGINEGVYLERVNQALAELQEGMEAFRREHEDAAKNAKAKLTMEVELVCLESADGGYGIKATYKSSLPRHPAQTSLAMAGQTQDGRRALLVRLDGSDDSHPRQSKMFSKAGSEEVDEE